MATRRPSAAGERDRAEAAATADQVVDDARRHLAMLAVAQHAAGPEDCLELLDMLGLRELLAHRHDAPSRAPDSTTR